MYCCLTKCGVYCVYETTVGMLIPGQKIFALSNIYISNLYIWRRWDSLDNYKSINSFIFSTVGPSANFIISLLFLYLLYISQASVGYLHFLPSFVSPSCFFLTTSCTGLSLQISKRGNLCPLVCFLCHINIHRDRKCQ